MGASGSTEDFISSVEIFKHEQNHTRDTEIDEAAFDADLLFADEPDIGVHGIGWMGREVPLAVTSAYLMTGNFFMKLRANISIIINQLSPL